MKNSFSLVLITMLVSCNSPNKIDGSDVQEDTMDSVSVEQIGEYVVETFEDSKGNLWFGTLEKGAAKYDGNELIYVTTNDGLPSNRVVSITEDVLGNLWFGTGEGISKYDGKAFTNYTTRNGLCSDMISELFIDSKGILWIGTWGGVSRFDGKQFETLELPCPKVETQINVDTKDWITVITEDDQGNLWFGRDGYGATKYVGEFFEFLRTKDSLLSNNVHTITEDMDGNLWIGTRVAEMDNADETKRIGKGGLNKYDGREMVSFPEVAGLTHNDVYCTYLDNSGTVWIGTTNNGVYKYSNGEFKNYTVLNSTMSILKDDSGKMWFGCAGGLYSINQNGEVVNVTIEGPW